MSIGPAYGPIGYHSLGRVYPRDRLRVPFEGRARRGPGRANMTAVMAVGIDRPCLTMTLQTGRLGMMLFGPPRVTMTLQTGTVTMTQVGCDDILT